MTSYIISDGTPGSKVVVRDRHAALEIASLVSGFGDTGTATIEEVEGETQRCEGCFGGTGAGRCGGFGSTGVRDSDLERLLERARNYQMSDAELKQQAQSWVRGELTSSTA